MSYPSTRHPQLELTPKIARPTESSPTEEPASTFVLIGKIRSGAVTTSPTVVSHVVSDA